MTEEENEAIEIYKLEDFIFTFKFINNTECYAYKVAKEKLELLK